MADRPRRTPRLLARALLGLSLAACQPMPTTRPPAQLTLERHAGDLIVRVAAPAPYQLQYLRVTGWDRVEGTLSGPGLAPLTVSAPVVDDPSAGRRAATLVFSAVPPGDHYALALRFLRATGGAAPEVVGTDAYDALAIAGGATTLTLDRPPEARVRRPIAQPATFDAYVTSIPEFGKTGGVINGRDAQTDAAGRTFVLDDSQLRQIARDAQGTYSIVTLAGQPASLGEGLVDGPGHRARFQNPTRLVIGPDGTLYIADTGNHCIRKVVLDAKGAATVSTVAGGPSPGYADGAGSSARFNGPEGLTIDASGTLYVADTGNQRIRRIDFDAAGQPTVSTLAGDGTPGHADGPSAAARFFNPKGIDLDSHGTLYVADASNRRVRAIARDAAGDVLVRTIAGDGTNGNTDGPGPSAQLRPPTALRVGRDDQIYVLAGPVLRRITPNPTGDAMVSTLAGLGSVADADCTGAQLKLSDPRGLAVQPSGDVLIVERGIVRRLQADAALGFLASRFLGSYATPLEGLSGDGPALDHAAYEPNNLAVDAAGNVVMTTLSRHVLLRLDARALNAPPTVLAGTGVAGHRDGPGAGAQFNLLQEIERGPDGAYYAADYFNECIRKIALDASGQATVTTVAGTPQSRGSQNGPALSAQFYRPTGVAFDHEGNMYVSENYNHTIRKLTFDATGGATVSLVAGQPLTAGFADGPGAGAKFNFPSGLTFDHARKTLLVADSGNRAIRAITFDAAGQPTVSTLAGGHFGSADGPGDVAGFSSPRDVLVTPGGDVYVADILRLRRIVRDAQNQVHVTTVAGSDAGFADGPALRARFGNANGGGLVGLAFAPDGGLYMADSGNRLLRKLITR